MECTSLTSSGAEVGKTCPKGMNCEECVPPEKVVVESVGPLPRTAHRGLSVTDETCVASTMCKVCWESDTPPTDHSNSTYTFHIWGSCNEMIDSVSGDAAWKAKSTVAESDAFVASPV